MCENTAKAEEGAPVLTSTADAIAYLSAEFTKMCEEYGGPKQYLMQLTSTQECHMIFEKGREQSLSSTCLESSQEIRTHHITEHF